MNNLNVTLIQSHLHWENPLANRAHLAGLLAEVKVSTDLIILPEMFTSGFTMNAEPLAEKMDGQTLKWMIDQAKKYNSAITGSLIISEENQFFNRLFFVYPEGHVETYDKRHTFTLAKEDQTFTAGNKKLIVDYKGWKICPLICYDLRFPVWARNVEDYDLLIYTANWPKRRIAAWDALLKARAIENMAYCVGVNRVGLDGNGHEYTGHSACYDVLGEQLSTSDHEKAFVETVVLSKEKLIKHRKHLQFLQDRDKFNLV